MKTTIELCGYLITIDGTDDGESIHVSATKDDETVEEFTLECGEGSQELPEGEEGDDIKGFDDFGGEEEDFGDEDSEDAEEDLEDAEGDLDDAEEDIEDAEEDLEDDDKKLESFSTFFNKKKKK